MTAPEAASRLRRAATAVQPITISPRRNTAAAGGSEVNKDKSASAASSPRGGGGSSSAASSPRGGSGAVPRAASPPRATSPRSATVSTRPGSYLPPRRVTLGRISDSDVDAVAVDAVPPQRKSPEPLAGPRVPELRLHVALVSPRDGPRKSPDPTPRKSPEPSPRLAEPAAAQPRVHFGAPTVAAVDVRCACRVSWCVLFYVAPLTRSRTDPRAARIDCTPATNRWRTRRSSRRWPARPTTRSCWTRCRS